MNDTQVNERAQRILRVLIEHYLENGQPIGSKTIVQESGLALSPATVRNVLAELEEHGLLEQPHTSAGRVPTDLGLRFFVDTIMHVEPMPQSAEAQLRQQLGVDQTPRDLLQHASSLLSQVTHLAGLVSLPKRDRVILRHLEFLALSDQRILVITVVNDYEVQNSVIRPQTPYTPIELQEIANYLNHHFAGKNITHIRTELLASLRADKDNMMRLMQAALDITDHALQQDSQQGFLLAGETNLVSQADGSNLGVLKSLLDAFTYKQEILRLLDHCIQAEGVQIFIGNQAGYDVLGGYSLVAAPYQSDDIVGVVGVIGPTRMAYNRVVSVVDVTARLLTSALSRTTFTE
jgi:heat-inducible transcriptional repressor